jgi:hypothetical protein
VRPPLISRKNDAAPVTGAARLGEVHPRQVTPGAPSLLAQNLVQLRRTEPG